MNKDLNTAKTAAIAAAVKTIKAAILQSRYQAARLANAEMLKLYFAIGGYVSANSTVDERLFYIRKCASEFWSKRVLLQHLKANDYAAQGKAVSNFELTMPDERQVTRAVQAFKDEYLLDFVNIVDANDDEETLDEPEWMMEMVAKIRHFIQALGPDFCFMDVKKRFVVEGDELFADLAFFHRAQNRFWNNPLPE